MESTGHLYALLLIALLSSVLHSSQTSVLPVQPNGTICLDCKVNNTLYALWTKGDRSEETKLFELIPAVPTRLAKKLNLMTNSSCNSSKYAIKVPNVMIDFNDGNYSCWENHKLVTSYHVKVQVTPIVQVSEKNHIQHHVANITAKCSITGFIPPINVSWFVDGNLHTVTFLEEPAKLKTDITLSEEFTREGKRATEIVCAIEGPYTTPTNGSLEIEPIDKGTGATGLIYLLVPALFAISMGTSIYLYYKVKNDNNKKRVSGPTIDPPAAIVDNNDDSTVYDDVNETESPIGNGSKQNDGAANDYTTRLVTLVKTSGMFDYWNASYQKGDAEKTKQCFAKTLSGSATMAEASTFQSFARKLRSLKDHRNLLKIVSISVDELPYSVFYEYMDCGSLRDFMMRHYQQARRSHAISDKRGNDLRRLENMSKQQSELIYFVSSIANGMKFICSQKFSHPALRLKKVMISDDFECKLYDIYPTENAMTKVEEIMKKDHPPVAWLAPETVFLQEYTHASDMWGFAVLMWEIFSLGDVPFARQTESEIERQIREGVVLPQPLCCPGAMYGLMLSAWNTNKPKRPTFDGIVQKIDSVAKKFQEESSASKTLKSPPEENSYFVLNTAYSSADNYI